MAVEAEFAAPVARLLELGEPRCTSPQEWINYREYNLGPEHIPALIQLASDLALLNCPDEADRRCWGPVHAWRALGQLHALQAIEPLLHLFHAVPDNDWIIEEMPDVFALIGPRAFSLLAAYLADTARPTYSRLIAATSLMEIARRAPELRDITIVALVGQLVSYRSNSPGVNGVLIANLVELHASEYSDLIHRVFVESKVDRFIVGDWRDVRLMLSPNGHSTVLNSAAVLAATRKKAAADPVERSPEASSARSAGNEARTQPRPRSRSPSA
jgi:hypothetical protein